MTRVVPRVGDVRRLAHPTTAAGQARDNPAPTIALIFIALVAVQAYKSGSLPTVQQAGAYAGAAIAFIVLATVAPDLVTWSLLLVLLFVFLTNAAVIETGIARFTAALGNTGAAFTKLPLAPAVSVGPQGGVA